MCTFVFKLSFISVVLGCARFFKYSFCYMCLCACSNSHQQWFMALQKVAPCKFKCGQKFFDYWFFDVRWIALYCELDKKIVCQFFLDKHFLNNNLTSNLILIAIKLRWIHGTIIQRNVYFLSTVIYIYHISMYNYHQLVIQNLIIFQAICSKLFSTKITQFMKR